MPKIKVKSLDVSVPLPAYATSGSAGLDLYAAVPAPVLLQPSSRALIPCGFALELPEGYEAQIRPRSGLALKFGITVANAPGTVDSDYRGEVKVILINLSDKPYTVEPGHRIAQMVIARVERAVLEPADTLDATERGAGGFGSTGQTGESLKGPGLSNVGVHHEGAEVV